MIRLKTESCTTFILICLTCINAQAESPLEISNAWIAETPPSTGVNAGYALIENRGNETMILESVSNPLFTRIEIHQNIIENNITRMEHHLTVTIPPGESLLFQPGGFHLMLYNARTELTTGDSVSLVFTFSGGHSLNVEAEVRKLSIPHHQDRQQHEETTGSTMLDKIKVSYQHLLPQHFLSGMMYRLTRTTLTPLKNFLISSFIRIFNVDMSVAEVQDPLKYQHFNDFFTRALKPDARPVDNSVDAVVSPVDGTVSQLGNIVNGQIIQAKGRDYSALALLGGNQELADIFADGKFITIYLSPRDYHRIHMPLSGSLQTMTYIPGDLFSVNPTTTAGLDNLFARNERVVSVFDTEIGTMALVMVGAIFVGSMETVWAGEITPATTREKSTVHYDNNGNMVTLSKGEEMGRFNMGSTVILLFEKNRLDWDSVIQPESGVTLGHKVAEIKSRKPSVLN